MYIENWLLFLSSSQSDSVSRLFAPHTPRPQSIRAKCRRSTYLRIDIRFCPLLLLLFPSKLVLILMMTASASALIQRSGRKHAQRRESANIEKYYHDYEAEAKSLGIFAIFGISRMIRC